MLTVCCTENPVTERIEGVTKPGPLLREVPGECPPGESWIYQVLLPMWRLEKYQPEAPSLTFLLLAVMPTSKG